MRLISKNLLTAALSLPIIALVVRYLLLWDRLPSVLAIHFDLQGAPDGWLGRGLFFLLLTAWLGGQVAIFHILVRRLGTALLTAVSMLHFTVIGILCATAWFLLDYNLDKTPLPWLWIAAIGLVSGAIPVLLMASLNKGERKGAALPKQGTILHEEIHCSSFLPVLTGSIFAILLAIMITTGYLIYPSPFVLLIVLLIAFFCTVGISSTVFIGYGFHYRFTEEGIEVRHLLGTSLVIPLSAIAEYGTQQCSPLKDFGGWGIRYGLGGKAYIWQGRDVLKVKYDNRIVYLGHHHPESLVRKLDEIIERRA